MPDKGAWTVKALPTPLFDSTAFFSICYDILAVENVGKNAEIYLRNSENEKHRKITTTQPEYFDGIRSIPINQIEVPPCFKKNRPAEKKIDSMIEYYKERGHFDKPVTVVFRDDKYVLKDKFLRYYVGKELKLKEIDAICTVDQYSKENDDNVW